MRKTIATLLIAISAIGVANAAPATATAQESFDQDGYTYVYTTSVNAKGNQTITGTRYPDNTPFTLTVKGNQVEGQSDGQAVAFSVDEAKGAAKDAEINVVAKPKA